MPDCGSSLSTYIYLLLKVRSRFPRTWWIRSNYALEVRFPEVLGLAVILYSYSIRDFLDSLPINSDPWSYIISIGIGYLINHIVSTKFTIYIAIFSSYLIDPNHPVTGYIVVTYFRFKFSLCPFLFLMYGPYIYTEFVPRHVNVETMWGNISMYVIYLRYLSICTWIHDLMVFMI